MRRDHIRKAADCPTCGAKAGAPCVWARPKKPEGRNHHERQKVAQAWVAEKMRGNAERPKLPPKPRKVKPPSPTFYTSWEWKAARYEALRIQGRRCQCCGWRPGDTDQGHLVVDHIKPLALFPELGLSQGNLQVLCNDCNMGKGRKHDEDFR